MIYFIKILNIEKNEYMYIMHYNHFDNELLLTDDIMERQEYLSEDSLLEDFNAIIKNNTIDMDKNLLIIGAY